MDICNSKGLIIWLTGLSGSGKSTISEILFKKLTQKRRLAYILDGDKLRKGLNGDLGFSSHDRKENIRRIAHVAAILYDLGSVTIVSAISPHREMRKYARALVPDGDFIEVYIKTNIAECIKRDPKGLYEKALDNRIPEFTGISSPYEEPVDPEIIIETTNTTPEDAADEILKYLT